jgi:SAM-dependent methyltransferase
VRGLLEKFPQARAQTANVARLPFDSETLDAVLGLCVFDSFADPARASHEIRRVLRDGGRFIHFLDAATNIEPLLTQLVAAGQLPLPNFLADIALGRPDLLQVMHVEHLIRPYHDVLSVSLSQMSAIREMLQQAGHLMAGMLDRYMGAFTKRPFDPLPAARTFVELTSDPEVGRPLNQALTSLFTTLKQPPYSNYLPFDLHSHSSLAHFQNTLERYFGPDFGYRLRLSTIVYARAYEVDDTAPLRARVRRVGIGQNSLDWPSPQGFPTQQLNSALPITDLSSVSPQSHVLHEAAIYCLVSEKS